MKLVTAAIIERDNKILITQRSREDRLSLKWEFPGGKIEGGETPEDCLTREILEELNLHIAVSGFFCESIYRYETGVIRLMAYRATILSGNLKLNVHHDARWVSAEELAGYDFAPADIDIVQKLMDLEG